MKIFLHTVASLAILAVSWTGIAKAQTQSECLPLWSTEMPEALFNPHPDQDRDLTLEVAKGLSFTFASVQLGTDSLYGQGTFKVGSADDEIFAVQQNVRLSSAMQDDDGQRVLYFGKYEVSTGQAVMLLGNGNFELGVQELRKTAPSLAKALAPNKACPTGLTPEQFALLSLPINGLAPSTLRSLTYRFNLLCFENASCQSTLASLSENPEISAYARLPVEIEWEYVARGGNKRALGEIDGLQFQEAEPGKVIGKNPHEIANLGGESLLPIGSLDDLDGIYDQFGNVAELQENAFATLGTFGAVGGQVVRGGHWKTLPKNLRVSTRAEIAPYADPARQHMDHETFGLRLVLGLPIFGATARLGSRELDKEFSTNFSALNNKTTDKAGDTLVESKVLGLVSKDALNLNDGLSLIDKDDFYNFTVGALSEISINVKSADPVQFTLLSELGQPINQTMALTDWPATQTLIPGSYYAHFSLGEDAQEQSYDVLMAASPAADTGEDSASDALLQANHPAHLDLVQTKSIQGFVGQDDLADTFGFTNTFSGYTGVKISVPKLLGSAKIRILSKSGKVRMEFLATSGRDETFSFASKPGQTGFLQVLKSDRGTNADYELAFEGTMIMPKGFEETQALALETSGIKVGEYQLNFVPGAQETHFKLNVTERKLVTLRLDQLRSDVDLRLRREDNQLVRSDHVRKGSLHEEFRLDLTPGIYVGRLVLKSDEEPTTGRLIYRQSPPLLSVIRTDAIAKKSPKLIGLGRVFLEMSGITYLELDKSVTKFTHMEYKFSSKNAITVTVDILDSNYNLLETNSFYKSTKFAVMVDPKTTASYIRISPKGSVQRAKLGLAGRRLGKLNSSITRSFVGTKISEHKDWEVYVNSARDLDSCWAVTEARNVTPDRTSWAPTRPAFMIEYVEKERPVWVALMQFESNPPQKLDVQYRSNGGSWNKVKGEIDGYAWLPVNQAKEFYVNASLSAFQRGTEIRVRGVARDSDENFEFFYSLSGYSAATAAAARACKTQAIRG